MTLPIRTHTAQVEPVDYHCADCGWFGAKTDTRAVVPGVGGTGRCCPECAARF